MVWSEGYEQRDKLDQHSISPQRPFDYHPLNTQTRGDSQRKDLFLVPALDGIPFRLSCITGDDGEIFPGDGEDGPSVGRVWVEAAV
jgi:hypothetical protein